MLTTALAVLPKPEDRQYPVYGHPDDPVCLRDFGPHVTDLIRDLVTHLELLKQHVDSMYSYADVARRATFVSREAAIDLVRFSFVFPRVLHEFGSLLQILDAIRFGETESYSKGVK